MAGLREKLTDFVVQYPVVGGLAIVAVGILMISESMEDAKRFHEFEFAREASAQVLSVSGPTFPPLRFDVNVSWTDEGSDAEGIVRVGPKAGHQLQEGDSIQILISKSGGSLMRASQRSEERPIQMAGLEATQQTFIGMLLSFSGAMVAMFGKRVFRNSKSPGS